VNWGGLPISRGSITVITLLPPMPAWYSYKVCKEASTAMTTRTLPVVAAVIIIAATTFGSAPVRAQANPDADQIINALKPTGSLSHSTRGIRPSAAQSAPTAAPAAAASAPASTAATHAAPAPKVATATAPAAEAPSVNLSIQFANGSADLTPDAVKTLNELGRALSSEALSGYRFRIEGHTDTVGSPGYNKTLSQQRAEKVAEYLEQKFGVAAPRLQPIGEGEAHLLVPTPDQTAEPRNRRVQIVNIGA
jgi:OOP family OmpA-OmpF porin